MVELWLNGSKRARHIGQVLDRVLLRRTKEGRSEDIVLPPKTIVLRKVVLL